MLKRECIQFQVPRNPDVKYSVVERAHRTIRDRLYKYFTYKNTYRYIDVLKKFVRAYNDTIHSATDRFGRPRDIEKAKFRVGQYVRVSKEKMKFAKSYVQNFHSEIFRIAKVIERHPRPIYELGDF